MAKLNRLTTILLDVFDDQLDIGRLTLMARARTLLDAQLKGLSCPVLRGGGTVSKPQADEHVEAEYKTFDIRRRPMRAERTAQELAALKAADKEIPKIRRGRPPKMMKPD